jgi:hypothetical protein
MLLSFHRSQKMSLKTAKPGELRAFVFDVALGLGKASSAVDPESGMLVDLTAMDAFLSGLRVSLASQHWSSLTEMLQSSLSLAREFAADEGASLQELCFREARGFFLGWRGTELMGQREVLELGGELYRVTATWPLTEKDLGKRLTVNSRDELSGKSVFESNPELIEIHIESLSTQEITAIRR